MKELNDLIVLRRHIDCIVKYCSEHSCVMCNMQAFCSQHQSDTCKGKYFIAEGKKALSVVEKAIKALEDKV